MSYTVDANGSASRTGTIQVLGQQFSITQTGITNCVANPTTATVAASGGFRRHVCTFLCRRTEPARATVRRLWQNCQATFRQCEQGRLGLLAVSLWFGTLLCLALKVFRIVEARKRRHVDTGRIRTDAEYIAEYSGRDRGAAIALALFFGVLTAFLALRSTPVAVISGAVFCWSAWYVMQVTVTRIHFTRERIIARLPWFKEISEPYGSVLRLHSRPGTVDVSDHLIHGESPVLMHDVHQHHADLYQPFQGVVKFEIELGVSAWFRPRIAPGLPGTIISADSADSPPAVGRAKNRRDRFSITTVGRPFLQR